MRQDNSCSCGSGKKFKYCCGRRVGGEKSREPSFKKPNRHYFQEKGAAAERIIHTLATKTFFADWCYLNPKRADGKELCDLLIVFDETAVIWQIKDLKARDLGGQRQREVEKNLRQLNGARRYVFDLKAPIWLDNPRRGREQLNPDQIKHVHLISVLMGDNNEPFPFFEVVKNKLVHVFTRRFADIALSELDTVSDFCEYLRLKEAIDPAKELLVIGGEENLLCKFLESRSFSWMDNYDVITVDDGAWSAFSKIPSVRAKKDADRISYGWDSIIERAHDGTSMRYEKIARELARPNRFQRRILAASFFEAYCEYRESGQEIMRRLTDLEGTTYCFLFSERHGHFHDARKQMLQLMCFVARGIRRENEKVIGIATEAENRSYDFCLVQRPVWTESDEAIKLGIQRETGIFVSPRQGRASAIEYPILQKH